MAYIWRLSVFSTGKQTHSDGEGRGERSPGKKQKSSYLMSLKKWKRVLRGTSLSCRKNWKNVAKVWTIKKAEHQTIDAFELWCWKRLLRVTWTVGWSNQSILKETNIDYSLEGLMWKLKLQYFGYLMWRANSLKRTLMLGKIEGRRRRGW